MGARILIALSVLIAAAGAARADDPPPAKKPAEKPASLERTELDKRAFKAAYESVKLGYELWKDTNYEGCFRLYQGTVMALLPMLDHRPKLAALVKDRLEQAKELKAEKGAFLLREALDAIVKDTMDATLAEVPKKAPLWDRLGGEKVVKAVVHDFLESAVKDPKVNFSRDGKYKTDAKALARIEELLVELISEVGRGPLDYSGGDVKKAHAGMKITDAEFDAMIGHIAAALKKNKVPQADADELVKFVASVKSAFVGQ